MKLVHTCKIVIIYTQYIYLTINKSIFINTKRIFEGDNKKVN